MVKKHQGLPGPQGIDPYLCWARLTAFRGYGRASSTGSEAVPRIGVLIESDPGFASRVHDRFKELLIQDMPGNATSRVFSMECSRQELDLILADGSFKVRRYELSTARIAPGPAGIRSKGSRNQQAGAPDDSGQPARCKAPNVLVVIDDGFGFLNYRFAGPSGESRVFCLWDQGLEAEHPKWKTPTDLGYGAELSHEAIIDLGRGVRTATDEVRVYKSIDYRAALRDATHGTHVAGCAIDAIPKGVDFAVILVQLPREVSVDTSGAGTPKHVLDALHYALSRVSPSANVVVNISFGALAGPHDGSTLLEQAIDALTLQEQQRRNFVVVMPAGNAFNGQCHAHLTLKPGCSASLPWQVMREDPTESFCELWYPENAFGSIGITLRNPSGLIAGAYNCPIRPSTGTKPASSAVLHVKHAHAGAGKSLALCALAPTSPSQRGWLAAQAGTWSINVTNQGAQPASLDAWIQRDNAVMFGPFQSRQSHFRMSGLPRPFQQDDGGGELVARRGTGNSIGHGNEVIVVGGVLGPDFALTDYSSMRPSGFGRDWPDILAMADRNRSRPGLLGLGTYSGTHVWMNGTSVAAPHVAGLVFGAFVGQRVTTDALRKELRHRSVGAVSPRSLFERERSGTGAVV
jgi:hypothetical protein